MTIDTLEPTATDANSPPTDLMSKPVKLPRQKQTKFLSCPPDTVIHLRIDVQEKYGSQWGDWWQPMKTETAALTDGLKQRGVKTVHVAFSEGIQPLAKGIELRRNISPSIVCQLQQKKDWFDYAIGHNDLIALKGQCSAAKEGSIVHYLNQGGYKTLILSGVFEYKFQPLGAGLIDTVSGWCVSESARDFRQAGFNVVIAANATNCAIEDNIFFSRLALRRMVHKKWGVEILQPSAIYKGLILSNMKDIAHERTAQQAKGHGPTPHP